MEKVVIIGSGPAGYTAAVYAARANLEPLVISGNTIGGLLTQTSEVENFPGFPEGVNGYELTMKMQTQAEKFGARLEIANVEKLELTDGGVQKITLDRLLQRVAQRLLKFLLKRHTSARSPHGSSVVTVGHTISDLAVLTTYSHPVRT